MKHLRKSQPFAYEHLFFLFICLFFLSGCATVLETSIESKIESDGVVPGSLYFALHEVNITNRTRDTTESFLLDAIITRHWQEKRYERFWEIKHIQRYEKVWKAGEHPGASAIVRSKRQVTQVSRDQSDQRKTVRQESTNVRSMFLEPRVITKKKFIRDIPLEPVHKKEAVDIPVPIDITMNGKLQEQKSVRPGEPFLVDILKYGYPFRADLSLVFDLRSSNIRTSPPGMFRFSFRKEELIKRYIASGKRYGRIPNLTVVQSRAVEHAENPDLLLEGGDSVILYARVSNDKQSGASYYTKVKLYDSDRKLTVAESPIIQALYAGESHEVQIPIALAFARTPENRRFWVIAEDELGAKSSAIPVMLSIKATSSVPQLQLLSATVDEDTLSGDKIVTIRIRNRGSRTAEGILLEFDDIHPEGVLSQRKLSVANIDAHSQKVVQIPVVKKHISSSDVQFLVRVRERMGISTDEKEMKLANILFL